MRRRELQAPFPEDNFGDLIAEDEHQSMKVIDAFKKVFFISPTPVDRSVLGETDCTDIPLVNLRAGGP